MAKLVTIPADGSVLVGLTDPPTTSVACQVYGINYDPAPAYTATPVQAGFDGLLTYTGSAGASLTLAWLPDAGEVDSLSDFLEANAGATIYVQARATSTSQLYTYTCQAVPGGDLLGPAGQVLTTSVRLPVSARVKA